MQLKVKRLFAGAAPIPQYETAGAACFDIKSANTSRSVAPGEQCNFATGLAFEVPEGHVMLVFSRSGHGFKNQVRLSNCVGVIDSDYRGELRVALKNDGANWLVVNHGDRIAQAMLVPIPRVQLVAADDLSETQRGTGGFGSTGA